PAPPAGTGEPVARAGRRRHHHLAAGAVEYLRCVHGRHARRTDAGLPAVLLLQPHQPAAGGGVCLRGLQDQAHAAGRTHRDRPRRNTMSATGQLIEAAYRQTLARFREEVADGRRDALAELPAYRRRRRDYLTLRRLERIPEEARELAEQLLRTHGVNLDAAARETFEREVTDLLIRLYEAFIAHAQAPQGNR